MTLFGSTLLLLGSIPAFLGAQPSNVQTAPVLAERVAERIAERWCIPPDALCLEWGACAETVLIAGEGPFRITGNGGDGWFAVVFDSTTAGAVALRVRAGIRDTVMFASRPLAAGCRIGEGDLRPEAVLHWGAPQFDRAGLPAPGWEVRRHLAAGDVVAWPAATPPSLIVAGEPVRLEWMHGAVKVSVIGLALNSARKGEPVQVRLRGRGGRLSGIATEAGKAVLATEGGDR